MLLSSYPLISGSPYLLIRLILEELLAGLLEHSGRPVHAASGGPGEPAVGGSWQLELQRRQVLHGKISEVVSCNLTLIIHSLID